MIYFWIHSGDISRNGDISFVWKDVFCHRIWRYILSGRYLSPKKLNYISISEIYLQKISKLEIYREDISILGNLKKPQKSACAFLDIKFFGYQIFVDRALVFSRYPHIFLEISRSHKCKKTCQDLKGFVFCAKFGRVPVKMMSICFCQISSIFAAQSLPN